MSKITFVTLLSGGVLLLALSAAASSPFDISFPIAELGNCADRESCKAYCDDTAHSAGCFEFAQKHGLASREESAGAKILKETEQGPGGCQDENECRTYCNDPAHIDECLAFAEEHGFVSKEDAARVRKAGFTTGPGGCKGDQCRDYCEDPAHHAECIEFAEKNGLMSKEEVARARKFAGKEGPGGCRGEECRKFCENPANQEICLEFAAREGLMPPEELERARKFLKASQEGGPGGCKGQECRTYCEDPAHQDECFEFAKKQGLINPEDEKRFETGKKIRQKMQETGGPGGCKTEEECHAYCSDPGRVEECVAFGAAHGGIPEGEVRQMLKDFQEHRFEAQGGFRPPEEFRRFEEEAHRRFQEFRELEQLRSDIRHEVSSDVPQDEFGRCVSDIASSVDKELLRTDSLEFSRRHTEAVRQCAEKLRGGFPAGRQDFPGSPPAGGEQFPGQFPTRPPEDFRQPPEGFNSPEGFRPPEGFQPEQFTRPAGETFQHQESTSGSLVPANQEDFAGRCAAEGGTWTGTTCEFHSEPQSGSGQKGFFASILEFFGR